MTYSDYQITIQDYESFCNSCDTPESLAAIWSDVLERIKEDEILKEAKKKGFDLIDNPDIENDPVADYKLIVVKDGSEEVHQYFEEQIYSYIVCLKI